MRLDELDLERYGAFDHLRLTFDGPGLTVVYGLNEAGKSTCLAAIGDFLFRVPERSSRASVFGSDVLRIGAVLSTSEGRQLRLKRRYGRVRTLINDAGQPVEDEVLGSLLGATSRERFESLFGLDHESLRQGGDQLLRADGEIGRLIVEAGGGLRTLMARLDGLDEEIDSLFSPKGRGEKRAFSRALGAFDTADKAARAHVLTREAYERDRKAQAAAEAALEQARRQRRELAQTLARQERVARVMPTLRELERTETDLRGYGDVAVLAAGFTDDCERTLDDRDAAAHAFEEADASRVQLVKRLDALVVDQPLLDAEGAIREIEGGATLVAAARGDRPNRLKEQNSSEAALESLRQRLRLGPDDPLEPLAPAPEVLEDVRRLANAALERRPALTGAAEAVAAAEALVSDTDARLAEWRRRGRDAPFGVDAANFATLAADWASAERRRDLARDQLGGQARAAVALGVADLEALRAIHCPDLEHLRRDLESRNGLGADLTKLKLARATAERQRDAALADIERLRLGGEIATDEALAEARGARGRAWAPIRAAHLAGGTDRSEEVRASDVAMLETELAHVDRLSDARTSEAQRVASLIEAERRLLEADAAMNAADADAAITIRALEDRSQALLAAFPDACALHPDPAALLSFVQDRAAVLAEVTRASAAAEEAEVALAELAPTLRLLEANEARAGLSPAPSDALAVRIQRLMQAINQHDRDHAEQQRDTREIVVQRRALAEAKRALERLQTEQRAWEAEWVAAMSEMRLQADTRPEAAADLAMQWNSARGEMRSLALTVRRLKRMEEDEADLLSRVATMATRLNLVLPEDPVAAAGMLVEHWRKADGVRLSRSTLAPELEAANATCDRRSAAVLAARERLANLAAAAGVAVEDDEALKRVGERRRACAKLEAECARLVAAARSAGDGLELAALQSEAQAQDLDAVRADIADLKRRLETLDEELEAHVREAHRAGEILRQHDEPSAIARAVAEREGATADMHAAVERYVELKVARELVAQAIQSVREEQQDPLIREAGRLFAHMTRGEFSAVASDVDVKGAPVVVGVRSGGGREAVASMSDGTRDQLFLAFRLASLANYCAATEPLPFIADDILVHFDDPRGAATLDLLAEFSATTQVLLFTHHLSVRAAAERLAREGRASIVDLEGRVAA